MCLTRSLCLYKVIIDVNLFLVSGKKNFQKPEPYIQMLELRLLDIENGQCKEETEMAKDAYPLFFVYPLPPSKMSKGSVCSRLYYRI